MASLANRVKMPVTLTTFLIVSKFLNLNSQHRVLREGCLNLKTPEDSITNMIFSSMASYSLSKHRVELLGDIVLFVGDPLGTEVENEVGVGL